MRRAAASVLQFLKIGAQTIDVTGCWGNLYAPGAAHRAHSHPNNYLSAVYYVRTWPGADTINFDDPRSQAGVIRPPVTALNANASGENRVSVSFNLMFPAFAAELSKPMWGDEAMTIALLARLFFTLGT